MDVAALIVMALVTLGAPLLACEWQRRRARSDRPADSRVIVVWLMADHDYALRALRAFLDEFVPTVERIAQESASTETVLSAKERSDEWKVSAAFEYELQREIECWEAIRVKIDERVTERRTMVDEQSRKRQAERDTFT